MKKIARDKNSSLFAVASATKKTKFFPHRHLIPLLPQVVVVVRLHVLLEVPDVGEAAVADGTRVVQVLAQR
jgi:hypothetical protein